MAWTINYTFVDKRLKTSRTEVKLPSVTSLAHVMEFAKTFAETVDKLSNSKLGAINIATPTILSSEFTAKPIAGLTADNEEKGTFLFNTSFRDPVRMQIPGFKDSLVIEGSNSIDQSDVDVATYIAIMIAGLTLGDLTVIQPCDIGDEDIVSIKDAYESFKSRKR